MAVDHEMSQEKQLWRIRLKRSVVKFSATGVGPYKLITLFCPELLR